MTANLFNTLPLNSDLQLVLNELGFAEMTPIQAASIPPLLQGKDVLGQSKTGSGKTAAFSLPILHNLDLKDRRIQALILCPTRELAVQVVTEIRRLGRRHEGLQVLALTGGQPGREQGQALDKGVHIAVGTPGRILDHMDRDRLDLSAMKTLVLDEADKMLDLGFDKELRSILQNLPVKRQTALFSATFPDTIKSLSNRYQKNPMKIEIIEDEDDANIEQIVYDANPEDKLNILMRVLQQHPADSTIVFCNMKTTVTEIEETIRNQGVNCAALHGDLDQRARDRVMAMFRNGSLKILVATDVAARGLDIENLELVVNYDLPLTPETYVHRIGRTGRAGKSGVAVTLAHPKDAIKLIEYEKAASAKIVPGTLGFKNQHNIAFALGQSDMKTLSISGGRNDRLRPGDIVGALTKDSHLTAADIGKIEVQDKLSFVAVKAKVADKALDLLRNGKIKGQKFPVRYQK